MASGQWPAVLRQVHRLFQGGGVSGLTEGQLLDRFVVGRDEDAFGAIVARHGAMVLGVCRGVLDDPHDVEDAFQATFLVLVRKARGLRDRDRLAPWLYGVARKVAIRARADASRRKARERSGPGSQAVATVDADLRELRSTVREEVDRLPSNDRMAVVLCYLDGLTHQEAADRLGWPIGTVKGRLARARDRLRDRLVRRGVALPAALSAPDPAPGGPVPAGLAASTVRSATRLAGGHSLTAGVAAIPAASLMEGVIRTMFATKLKTGALALAATCVLAVPGVLAWQGGPGPGGPTPSKPAAGKSPDGARPDPAPAKPEPTAGASQARGKLVDDATRALATLDQLKTQGKAASPQTYDTWLRRLLDAQLGRANRDEKVELLKDYVARRAKMREEAVAFQASGGANYLDVVEAEYRHHEALSWLAEAEAERATAEPPAGRMGPPVGAARAPGDRPGRAGMARPAEKPAPTPAEEKQNRAILAKLEERIPMIFAHETPLEDVLKYVRQTTQDDGAGLPTGIPIYVDPAGLRKVEATMTSKVSIDLEGIPLRTTLRLFLRQLGLAYKVQDGLLQITNEEWNRRE